MKWRGREDQQDKRVNRMCSQVLLFFGFIKVIVLLLTFVVVPILVAGSSASDFLGHFFDDLGLLCFTIVFMAIGGLPYFITSGFAYGMRYPLLVTIPTILLFAFDTWFYLAVFFLIQNPDPLIGFVFLGMNVVFIGFAIIIGIFVGAVDVILENMMKGKK